MEWQKVTGETVRNHMAVELANAYDKWILAYPQKVGRLDEITASVRAEWRHTIASVPKNSLNPDEETLPDAVVRHVENVIQYEMGMEMGVTLTADGRRLIDQAEIYRRQIAYGHYKFYDDTNPQATTPSYVVPGKSAGRALGDLVALLLGAFLWCLPARAAWIQENNETTYVPVHYDITEQSLGGHLAGIDNAIGWLSDTNGLYGRLVGLPQLVYDTLDTIQEHSLYGDYRPEAESWLCLSQTNIMFHGQVMAAQLRTRKDEIAGTSGDVIVGGGIELGGVYRTNWPSGGGGGGNYLPAHQSLDLFLGYFYNYVVDDCVEMEPGYFEGGTLFPSNVIAQGAFVAGTGIYLGGEYRTNWPSGAGLVRVSATNTTVDSSDYLIWLDTRQFSASQSVTLTLPDMDANSQTIVVRRLGNDGAATIARGTNTWTLAYDGDGVTVDWLAAATNWFWREF